MKWILVMVALGACEHGQSPSTTNIRVAQLRCMHDSSFVAFDAQIEATLVDAQAVRVTFLPAVDGVQFSRTTDWECNGWTEVAGADGCARDVSQPESQTITVSESNTVNVGTLPATFEYTTVVSITSVEGSDVESVLLTDDCN